MIPYTTLIRFKMVLKCFKISCSWGPNVTRVLVNKKQCPCNEGAIFSIDAFNIVRNIYYLMEIIAREWQAMYFGAIAPT